MDIDSYFLILNFGFLFLDNAQWIYTLLALGLCADYVSCVLALNIRSVSNQITSSMLSLCYPYISIMLKFNNI